MTKGTRPETRAGSWIGSIAPLADADPLEALRPEPRVRRRVSRSGPGPPGRDERFGGLGAPGAPRTATAVEAWPGSPGPRRAIGGHGGRPEPRIKTRTTGSVAPRARRETGRGPCKEWFRARGR